MPKELKLKSRELLAGPGRAPARAMLKAVGFTDEDLSRPIIGVANTWIEVMPCNFHLRRLSERVKAGIRAAGGTPIEYNTIAVSDGISMGTEGMPTAIALLYAFILTSVRRKPTWTLSRSLQCTRDSCDGPNRQN